MYELDEETLKYLSEAEDIWRKQRKNIDHFLEFSKNNDFGDESIDINFGVNIFAVGSELLIFQILKNLKQGFLLISLIALRVLFENYINVHYIFQHPKHLRDRDWARKLCKDYLKRSYDSESQKNKLGDVSLHNRAKETGREKYYLLVYSELCNYSHFLATITNDLDQRFFKTQTIKTAIYVTTFYQDLLIAIASFYDCPFDIFVDELIVFREKGQNILGAIY